MLQFSISEETPRHLESCRYSSVHLLDEINTRLSLLEVLLSKALLYFVLYKNRFKNLNQHFQFYKKMLNVKIFITVMCQIYLLKKNFKYRINAEP